MNKPIIIAVVNRKGGVAKTTTVTNVGALLASKGHEVLVVDFDIQMNLTSYLLEDQAAYSIYDAITQAASFPSCIMQTSIEHLQLIAGSDQLTQIDLSAYDLRSELKKLEQEIIIIDTSPYFNDQIAVVLSSSDYVIIPTTADDDSVEGLINTVEELKALNSSRDFNYKILLTKVEKDSMTRQIIGEIEQYYKKSLYRTAIRYNSAAIRKSRSLQLPVALKYKHSKAAIDYMALVDEIEEEIICQG